MATYMQTLLSTIQQNITALQTELTNNGQDVTAHFQLHGPCPRDELSYMPSHAELDLLEKVQTDLVAIKDILMPNPHKLLHIAMGNLKTQALQTVIELGVADAIQELGGTVGVGSKALAEHCGANEIKLLRMLGILTTDNVFREVKPGVFANNRHSLGLLKGSGATAMLSLTAFENAEAAFAFTPWTSDPVAKDDFTPEKSPFTIRKGTKFYDFVAQPEGQKTLEKLMGGMVPWLNQITRPALLHDYPWASLGPVAIIDLGCSSGDVGFDILQLHPNVQRWDFQDLPPVIEQTKAALTPKLTELGLLSRATFTAHDYFSAQQQQQQQQQQQPKAADGDAENLVFFMRGVPRDYGDADVLAILRATAASMRSASLPASAQRPTLLINEIICPSGAVMSDDEVAVKAPSQCIPMATQSSFVDMANTMAMSATSFLNGAERTYTQYGKLLKDAGFEIVKLHRLRTFTCIMECRLKDQWREGGCS